MDCGIVVKLALTSGAVVHIFMNVTYGGAP